ncbi:MAG TPA: hypothetical protein PLI45_04960 [Candidatus Woesebacteria bacterium]|nr:hypothetical protein [Candidatus Woesebacteria bacterium]
MEFSLKVVEHEAEKYFQTGNILVNVLDCLYEFLGGSLKIMRGGMLIDEASIRMYGTHGEMPVFHTKLSSKWMKDKFGLISYEYLRLEADCFEVGDILLLTVLDEKKGFDLERALDCCRELTDEEKREIWLFGKSIGDTDKQIIDSIKDSRQPRDGTTYEESDGLKIYHRQL